MERLPWLRIRQSSVNPNKRKSVELSFRSVLIESQFTPRRAEPDPLEYCVTYNQSINFNLALFIASDTAKPESDLTQEAADCRSENFELIVSEQVQINPDNSRAMSALTFLSFKLNTKQNKSGQTLSQPKPWCNDNLVPF